MKLRTVKVTNFRSVNDSGEFRIGDLTCLVGKNESGKTTVLQALAGLEPYDDDPKLKYDRSRDYPRRYLNRYKERHPSSEARVVETTWDLGEDDVAAVEEIFGEGALSENKVTIRRTYARDAHWTLPINGEKIIQSIAQRAGCSAKELTSLKGKTSTAELFQELSGKEEKSVGLQALQAEITKFEGKSVINAVYDILKERTPGFLYFSNYHKMLGDVSLEQLQQAKASNALTAEDKVYLAFLDFAGTTPEELATLSRYEELKAQIESASISITEQIFEYWSQNRYLQVEFDVADGKPNDPAPLNSGRILHARIRNDLHKMTVPFNDRSAGFIWFFSFLVLFSQVVKEHGNVIILLDEPGLNLHATAQADLLRFIKEKLLPNHQVIYTTHSPFMVPTDDLSSVRTVEDVVRQTQNGRVESVGTVVSGDVLSTDRETLFPLQGALGYGITQSLFVGEHTLLVEGPAEILYFQAATAELESRGRKGLDRRWTPCPSYGVDKVQAFLSLFGGNKLHCAVLLDLAAGQKGKVEKLRNLENSLLRQGHVFTVADFTGTAEADVEDLFAPAVFARILNGTFSLTGKNALTGETLGAADAGGTSRLVRKAEVLVNKLLPAEKPEMSHYDPARWLIEHPEALRGNAPEVEETLARFEKMFAAFNALLKA